MADAHITKDHDGKSWTTVTDSEGRFVRRIPTHPSQIRPPRESCVWKPGTDVPSDRDQTTKVRAHLQEVKSTWKNKHRI